MFFCNIRQHIKTRCLFISVSIYGHSDNTIKKQDVHVCGNMHNESEYEPLDMRIIVAFTMVMSKRERV
jgi:hypothetical protein